MDQGGARTNSLSERVWVPAFARKTKGLQGPLPAQRDRGSSLTLQGCKISQNDLFIDVGQVFDLFYRSTFVDRVHGRPN